jgi:N-acetylmuramoyl-L-alanine amidase
VRHRGIGIASALLAGLAVCLAPAAVSVPTADPAPLAGKLIVVDPGHQLGNSNPRFAKQMAQTKFNGTMVKGCNTTGTATNSGLPESTFTWKVAQRLKSLLEKAGAKVVLTRTTNSYNDWGPCVWDRAGLANRLDADAMISIHADGAASSSKGFFAMAPTRIKGWTDDVVKVDRRLAHAMIAGMKQAGAVPSNYIRDQLLLTSNTTSLNFSNVPTTTIEVGNMRNASDARRMTSARGQQQYADWLFAGIERFFDR